MPLFIHMAHLQESFKNLLDDAYEESCVRFEVSMILEGLVSTVEIHQVECEKVDLVNELQESMFTCSNLEHELSCVQEVRFFRLMEFF